MNNKYHSNGKLLITGEYLVLEGAFSFALPLKYGQSLEISDYQNDSLLHWTTIVQDRIYLSVTFDPLNAFRIIDSSAHMNPSFLQRVLLQASILKPGLSKALINKQAVAAIEFDINWGWGSSSSLIVNIAQFAELNPFDLHFAVSHGSGYDIACAMANKPILYKIANSKPEFWEIDFHKEFLESIYFIYLGNKKDSSAAIRHFKDNSKSIEIESAEISDITNQMIKTNNLDTFMRLMKQHEHLIGEIIEIEPIQKRYFNDFDGAIKSLGAWGGDFIMAASRLPSNYIHQYFRDKNYNVIFNYQNIVL